MSEVFDERRRALEEEYIRRRDRESLTRLREALREEAHARGLGGSTMDCPRCDGTLKTETFDDVQIDRCDTCHGIWLDAGELEEIISKENAPGRWLSVFWPGDTSERNL